jgi:hypothetical protein
LTIEQYKRRKKEGRKKERKKMSGRDEETCHLFVGPP